MKKILFMFQIRLWVNGFQYGYTEKFAIVIVFILGQGIKLIIKLINDDYCR